MNVRIGECVKVCVCSNGSGMREKQGKEEGKEREKNKEWKEKMEMLKALCMSFRQGRSAGLSCLSRRLRG